MVVFAEEYIQLYIDQNSIGEKPIKNSLKTN